MQTCEHEITEQIELASGLSQSYDPETTAGLLCLDCDESWEIDSEY